MELLIIMLMAAAVISLGYIAYTFSKISGEGTDEKN